MKNSKNNRRFRLLMMSGLIATSLCAVDSQEGKKPEPLVTEISVEGNKYMQSTAIEKRLPFKKGEPFNADKTADAIHHTYALGYFKQVQIERTDSGPQSIKIAVRVQEKKLLEKVEFEGNKSLSTKKLSEKLNVDKLNSIDEEQLAGLIVALKSLYKDEHRHAPAISYQLIENKENPDKVTALFTINEGPKTLVKRVEFDGVKKVAKHKLRGSIYTRERWLLSFMDESGKYNPEMLDIDKHRIEMFYQDQGYWGAKATGVEVEKSADETEITVIFYVKEGERYMVRSISANGDDELSEKMLLGVCDLKAGDPMNRTKIADAINGIKALWGMKGYIHADVYPHIQPNDQTREVDITFAVEKGEKFYVNRIDITGNKITKDKVIRRHIELEEGDLITTTKLDFSKNQIESLGYFEREGVVWKIHKVGKNKCDLELVIQEAKTGHLNFSMSYGNDQHETERTVKFGIDAEKRNLFGLGWDVGGSVKTTRKRFKSAAIHFFDPYFLDFNMSTLLSAYIKRDEQEQWADVSESPIIKTVGGSTTLGFYLPQIDKRLQILTEIGVEDIRTEREIKSVTAANNSLFQQILDKRFQKGTLQWFGLALEKNTRNHPVYPYKGYRIKYSSNFALPGINKQFTYWKNEIEGSWFTSLIGVDSLIFTIHGRAGIITEITKAQQVPYKELYSMGGQDTVRGFTWGGVGPAYAPNGSPLGARKMLLFNAELQFPLIPDYSMKGHLFYDAGAGWDTPRAGGLRDKDLKRNTFAIRHSVGFGLNLLRPFPAKIDWGYKLNRDKSAGESASEFHISMNAAW